MSDQPALPTPPPIKMSLRRMALRIAGLALLIYGVHLGLDLAMNGVDRLPQAAQGPMRTALVLAMLVLYAALVAMPFVPGVEIGVSLMILRGSDIAPAVYIATLGGLTLAFLAGRYLPATVLQRLFLDLRLLRACALLKQIDGLSRDQRLAMLRQRIPGRLGGIAVRFRHVSLAILLNTPGNTVLGGGGGICLVAGLSGLFGLRAMVLTIALAVLPVPFSVWLYGTAVLQGAQLSP